MNLDELKNSWQEKHRQLGEGFDELAAKAQSRSSWFERTILRRDLVETAAAVVVALVFVYFLQFDYPPIARLGMVLMISGAIEVMIVLHWTRRRGGRPRLELPLNEYCGNELARVDRQIRLLRNVNWWYTGPLLLGACVFVYGVLFSLPELSPLVALPCFGAFCLLILIFGWGTYRINQRAVQRELMPLREELASIMQTLAVELPGMDESSKPLA